MWILRTQWQWLFLCPLLLFPACEERQNKRDEKEADHVFQNGSILRTPDTIFNRYGPGRNDFLTFEAIRSDTSFFLGTKTATFKTTTRIDTNVVTHNRFISITEDGAVQVSDYYSWLLIHDFAFYMNNELQWELELDLRKAHEKFGVALQQVNPLAPQLIGILPDHFVFEIIFAAPGSDWIDAYDLLITRTGEIDTMIKSWGVDYGCQFIGNPIYMDDKIVTCEGLYDIHSGEWISFTHDSVKTAFVSVVADHLLVQYIQPESKFTIRSLTGEVLHEWNAVYYGVGLGCTGNILQLDSLGNVAAFHETRTDENFQTSGEVHVFNVTNFSGIEKFKLNEIEHVNYKPLDMPELDVSPTTGANQKIYFDSLKPVYRATWDFSD